jgi:ketosteroid isomerase-like protein
MSQTTDEATLLQIAEGISAGDLSLLQAASDPGLEYTSRLTAVEGKTYYGHAGWATYLAELEAVWDCFRVTLEELMPVSEGNFVIAARVTAVARTSGVPIDQIVHVAWSLRDSKAIWGRAFATREEALEAVRVRE